MPEFGEIMAELRQDAGMTQQELAAKLFVATSTISNYETGQRRAHAEIICNVAAVFNVSTDYLLGRTELSLPPTIVNEEYIDGKNSKYAPATGNVVKQPTTADPLRSFG